MQTLLFQSEISVHFDHKTLHSVPCNTAVCCYDTSLSLSETVSEQSTSLARVIVQCPTSSGCDTGTVGHGSSLRNTHDSNHLHGVTLRLPLSTPPPRFICVTPAGLTGEQFPGRVGGKYISLIKDIWCLLSMLSADW